MFLPRRSFLILSLSGWLLAATTHGDEAPSGKTIHLLTVGNSFSHNATHYLGDLAKASGDTLVLHEDNVGGASLELHWGKVQAFEANPQDKAGRYSGGKSLKEDLTASHWDFVTIQQASIKSHDLATYQPFAKELSDYIKKYAPDATLLIHETWEYRVDDPRFSQSATAVGEPKSQDEMYRGLANAYATVAKELGLRWLPVGDAFHLANHDTHWAYHAPATAFDSKHAASGTLPDQTHSLNVGWNWKKQPDGTMKLAMDGHHAATSGEYLGACVWYEVMFGKSVETNSFVPKDLDPEYAKFLRATAHRAVQEAK
jgi:hypothetical protein